MSEPKNISEIPNWVIANMLLLDYDTQISIVAKLFQHLEREQITIALNMSGVSTCSDNNLVKCRNCDEEVEMIILETMCPRCNC